VHAVDGVVRVIYFRPDGASADLRLDPMRTKGKVSQFGEVERTQFALVPSYCVTVCSPSPEQRLAAPPIGLSRPPALARPPGSQVHRVQGCTVEGPLHILLNAEVRREPRPPRAAAGHASRRTPPTVVRPPSHPQFFSEGQAYVALSRVRRLEQLHLWTLDMDAFRTSPTIAAQYDRLRKLTLTQADIDAAPAVMRQPIPPVAAAVSAKRKR